MKSNSDHIKIVKQPDPTKIVLQCTVCAISKSHSLPSSIPDTVAFINGMEKEHAECGKAK